jgi:hypothetical protein
VLGEGCEVHWAVCGCSIRAGCCLDCQLEDDGGGVRGFGGFVEIMRVVARLRARKLHAQLLRGFRSAPRVPYDSQLGMCVIPLNVMKCHTDVDEHGTENWFRNFV